MAKRVYGLILRAAFTLGCVWFVVRGLDYGALAAAFRTVAPAAVGAVLCVFVVDYVTMGVRLRFISGRRLTLLGAVNACALCNGLNVFLPARMGEVAKVMYLRRVGGIHAGSGTGMVFWERFSDLNMLLVFTLVAAWLNGMLHVALPVAVVVVGVWGVLVVLFFFPAARTLCLKILYFERLRLFVSETLGQLRSGFQGRFFVTLMLLTLLPWALHWAQHVLLLRWVSAIDLSLSQTLLVFAISAGGFAIPSSPGNVGVYEAVVVAGLALFGVTREEALVFALIAHMTFHIPLAIYAAILMSVTGFKPSRLRRKATRDAERLSVE